MKQAPLDYKLNFILLEAMTDIKVNIMNIASVRCESVLMQEDLISLFSPSIF